MDSILTGRRGGLSEGSFAHAHSPKLHALIRKVTKVTGAAEEDGIWPSAAPPSVLLSLSRVQTPSVRPRPPHRRRGTGGGRSLFLRLRGFVFGGGDDGQNIPSSLAPSSFSAATPRPSLVPHSSPTLST